MGNGLASPPEPCMFSPAAPCLAWLPIPMATVVAGGATCPKTWVHSPHSGEHTHKIFFKAKIPCLADSSFFPIYNFLCLLTHSLACLPALPICPRHPTPVLIHTLLAPIACRGWINIHLEVRSPCSRDTCLGPTSKWLTPFADGTDGIRY
jgi:hypothetical protein